jgi:hypothetical protein
MDPYTMDTGKLGRDRWYGLHSPSDGPRGVYWFAGTSHVMHREGSITHGKKIIEEPQQ